MTILQEHAPGSLDGYDGTQKSKNRGSGWVAKIVSTKKRAVTDRPVIGTGVILLRGECVPENHFISYD